MSSIRSHACISRHHTCGSETAGVNLAVLQPARKVQCKLGCVQVCTRISAARVVIFSLGTIGYDSRVQAASAGKAGHEQACVLQHDQKSKRSSRLWQRLWQRKPKAQHPGDTPTSWTRVQQVIAMGTWSASLRLSAWQSGHRHAAVLGCLLTAGLCFLPCGMGAVRPSTAHRPCSRVSKHVHACRLNS